MTAQDVSSLSHVCRDKGRAAIRDWEQVNNLRRDNFQYLDAFAMYPISIGNYFAYFADFLLGISIASLFLVSGMAFWFLPLPIAQA